MSGYKNRGLMDPKRDNKKYPSSTRAFVLFAIVFFAPLFITGKTTGAAALKKDGQADIIRVGDFSEQDGVIAAPWKDLSFTGIKTVYTVEAHGKKAYIRAEANASASALYRPMDVNVAEYPMLSWRWKIEGVLKKGDARIKAGDDFAARLYVTFAYDPKKASLLMKGRSAIEEKLFGIKAPGSALNYIWANRLGQGSIVPSPYTGREMMIAVESGNRLAGRWQSEERNVFEDYIKAFGHKPRHVTGIAIMTDSDNTGGRATGYYDNISFRKKAKNGR